MIRVGVLSDTHLFEINSRFQQMVDACFSECSVILHAGDLVELSVLSAFSDKIVHAVCGNMCGHSVHSKLPSKKLITIGNFTIGLTHGQGMGFDPEDRLLVEFGGVDCIVYGHTHRAVCHRIGSTLIMNPGSFQSSGRHGASGSFGILEIDDAIGGSIHEVPSLP